VHQTQLDERTVIEVDTAKRDALLDLLEDVEPGKPVVVVTRFTHDLDSVQWVAEKLGRTYAELSGRRHDALTEDSTLAPGIEIAGVQIQSGGVGVDFSSSHICVLYSVGFSLGDYDQVLKRTHRPGQLNRVAYYHLIAEDTVDEKVYRALRERKNVVEYVLGLAE
jgi:SNF2 family DNA or RNA helicase